MVLDFALGGIILMTAIHGWMLGFVSPAVRIGGFIACFYMADPVRDQVRPFVLSRLPKIDPALMDRILWWVAAAVSYIILVGLTNLAIKLMHTPTPPEALWPKRIDQLAGLLLGTAKGALLAMFIAAGIHKYAPDQIENNDWLSVQSTRWLQQQISRSLALKWTERYQPVPQIWSSPPVRQFVEHIKRNGLKGPAESVNPGQVAESPS
jgi:uncharacterized membrane protein required for colicin V production